MSICEIKFKMLQFEFEFMKAKLNFNIIYWHLLKQIWLFWNCNQQNLLHSQNHKDYHFLTSVIACMCTVVSTWHSCHIHHLDSLAIHVVSHGSLSYLSVPSFEESHPTFGDVDAYDELLPTSMPLSGHQPFWTIHHLLKVLPMAPPGKTR